MFKLMWQMAISKAKPEQFPESKPLLLGLLCINFSILFYLIVLASGSVMAGFWRSLLVLSTIIFFTASILYGSRLQERFTKTLASLLATQCVILIVCVLPYLIILSIFNDAPANVFTTLGLGFCSLLLIFAACWLYLIYAYIFKSTLESSYRVGLVIALTLFSILALIFSVAN